MKTLPFLLGLTAATLFAPAIQAGKGEPAAPAAPKMDMAMTKVFGEAKAFSAKVVFSIKDAKSGKTTEMPCSFALLDGKVRTEMNLAEMSDPEVRKGAAEMSQMGMDVMVSISRWDLKKIYLIYPKMNAYMETPIPASEIGNADSPECKVDVVELGRETVAGQDCVKNRVTVSLPLSATTSSGTKVQEFIVWNATALKNFPVRIEVTDKKNPMTMTFSDIKLGAPAESLFEPPAGATRYPSMQAMMMGQMQQMMQGAFGR